MPVYVCSLKVDVPQSIPGDGGYHIVRFPYGAAESYDEHGMHQSAQPDGPTVTTWSTDDRSGLIWPTLEGWASLTAMIYWEAAGPADEYRDRFVRDPLGLAGGYDSTATEHRPPSPGMQCFHKSHEMFVHPGTPLGLLVAHSDSAPRKVTLAEFKLAIHT